MKASKVKITEVKPGEYMTNIPAIQLSSTKKDLTPKEFFESLCSRPQKK